MTVKKSANLVDFQKKKKVIKKENKVIRPKSRASAFSQKVGQTDRQTDWNFQNDP